MSNPEIVPIGQKPKRLTLLLWGESGCGKTTLASTAPGKKLLCMTDPDGELSVADFDDIYVMDLTKVNVEQFVNTDPFGILKAVDDHDFDTVIWDGITNAVDQVLTQAIKDTTNSTEKRVAIASYQMRNRYILRLIKTLNAGLRKRNKHFVVIAHQDAPLRDSEGNVKGYSLMIGGTLQTSAPVDFSEVWCMVDSSKGKHILIKPGRMRSPMKTRMFTTLAGVEFPWKFNPDTQDGDTLTSWWEMYTAGEFKKLALPKGK